MVAFGVIDFEDAWQPIDGRVLTLLMGMMIINASFEQSGFSTWLSAHALAGLRSPGCCSLR